MYFLGIFHLLVLYLVFNPFWVNFYIGLAKKVVWVFLKHLMETQISFWQTQCKFNLIHVDMEVFSISFIEETVFSPLYVFDTFVENWLNANVWIYYICYIFPLLHWFKCLFGGDGIPVELFQILKEDAVKVLHSICQQIWKTQQWPQDWKRSVFIPIPKKGNAKQCSNYHTIALISHASKVMLKILQFRL